MEIIMILIGLLMAVIILLIIARIIYKQITIKNLYVSFAQPCDPMSEELTKEYLQKIKNPDIDDIIVNDLELDKIFPLVNRTYSEVGREYAYAQMFVTTHQHEEMEHLIEVLKNDKILKKVLYEVYSLSKGYSQSLDFFDHDYILRKGDIFVALGSTLILMGLFVSCFFNIDMVLFLALWLAALMGIYSYYSSKTKDMMSQSQSYCYVVNAIKKLEKHNLFSDDVSQEIKQMVKRSQHYTFIYRVTMQFQKIDIFYLLELLKSVFSFPIYQCYILLNKKTELADDFMKMYEYVGMVELALSVITIRQNYETCIPNLAQDAVISFKDAYHPIIKNPVKNSFSSNESCFITGSNASGKSTFLKTVGVNMIMAKAYHTCFAKSFVYYPFQLCSSIHIKDDLESGESYFVKEIKTMKTILNQAKDKICLIFIDEILRGTNEKERIAISEVILKTLFKSQSLILVTTHDLSLVEKFINIKKYCFNDSVEDHTLKCDYKIKEGICEVGNAIKLLDVYDYDQEIIEQLKKPL